MNERPVGRYGSALDLIWKAKLLEVEQGCVDRQVWHRITKTPSQYLGHSFPQVPSQNTALLSPFLFLQFTIVRSYLSLHTLSWNLTRFAKSRFKYPCAEMLYWDLS